jgi:two-component system, NarL family, response regulator LiaR
MSYEMDNDAGESVMRVVLADGDPLARRTIRDALQRGGITVVAEAPTGGEAVELSTFYRPDAVLIDLKLPGLDGINATRKIHERAPGICIVVLADESESALGLRAIRAGAAGFLSRSIDPDALPRVLRGALDGEAAVSRRLAMELLESYRSAPRAGTGLRPVRSTLTDREWEVLDLVSAGAGTEEIARTLVLSTETVRSHLKNLYRKLGVRSREQAAEEARRLRDLVV